MVTDQSRDLPAASTNITLLIALQALVSAASLVVEIVAGRMLAPYLGMSLYTWTSVIAVVLAGFSAGHWAGGIFAGWTVRKALLATAWSMVAAAITTGTAGIVLRATAAPVISGLDQPIASIIALTTLAFFLPSFFAGIPAPVLAHVAVQQAGSKAGKALGAMFAAGALGAIGGTLAAGFIFISWFGTAVTLAIVTVSYALMALVLFLMAGVGGGQRATALGVTLAVAAGGMASPLAIENACTRESSYFCIRVIDAQADLGEAGRIMVLDHLVHGVAARDNPARLATEHSAMLDAISRMRVNRPDFSAYFIGGGSYTLPRYWNALSPTPAMTIAEIDPQVTQVAISDFWFEPGGARVVHEDARLLLAREEARYDVIIGDAFTDITVPAHLITREFFELVKTRLEPGGAYLMNVVDHADRLEALAAITTTLREVFPAVEIWAARRRPGADERLVFILVAADEPSRSGRLVSNPPEELDLGRLSQGAVDSLLARMDVPILTDTYAPIDRLMGALD